jgi:hypothetical protein
MSRWIVPQDDTNTMFVEFRHVSETEGATPAWWADRDIMLPGQITAESYEAGQRHPGDYEAQVSQWPTAIHGLEYLGGATRSDMACEPSKQEMNLLVCAVTTARSYPLTATTRSCMCRRPKPDRGSAAHARHRAAAGGGLPRGSAFDDPPLRHNGPRRTKKPGGSKPPRLFLRSWIC